MPFKTLAAPRKLSTLDNAELRSAAFLNDPGLVAFLSREPGKIAMFSFAGAAGKVTNVSVPRADAIALLNRDFAVVRGSDDSLWALLGITHTPKIEQVGRDIRSLAFRPGGNSALALGWDGSATELTIARTEVEARQFSLRGTLRAAFVGETENYVIADGADGGQLRVHPGATPEPGASLRVNLPAEVKEYDQVRGCPKLCAVWKPEKKVVCVATGGPNRLVAKLIHLEAAPTTLGVLETSLIVTFNDGRAALYDSDAIAAAEENGPITPKYTVSLGVRGKPESLLLTTKGGYTFWAGTSMGEVVSATVVKKAPPITG